MPARRCDDFMVSSARSKLQVNTRIIIAMGALFCSTCTSVINKTNNDHEVILAAIKEICDNDKPGSFVVPSTTGVVDRHLVINDLDREVRKSLIQRNKTSSKLPAVYACKKITVLETREIDNYFKAADKGGLHERWSAFRARYPDINGIMTFSLPGYSARGDTAVLQVMGACGPLCGNGSFWIFRKESGHWRVEKTIEGWTN